MADRTQRVIWTALPRGREDGDVTLTALASPRLASNVAPVERLEAWPDFETWADTVDRAEFIVHFGGHAVVAERVSRPDRAVWAALFPADTTVRSHAFEDRRGTTILSYPVTSVHDAVTSVYADVGSAAQDDFPDKRDLLVHLRELGRDGLEPRDVQRDYLAQLRDGGRRSFPGQVGAFRLHELYTLPLAARDHAGGTYVKQGDDDPRENATWRQHAFVDLPSPTELAERFDFHAIVAALNQYPHLLRLTGLAVDLRLPAGALPPGPLTDALSLEVHWHPQPEAATGVETLPDGVVETVTRVENDRLTAMPSVAGGLLADGLLALDDERLRIVQLDVDGAGIKLRNTARSYVVSASGKRSERDPGDLPTLRTAGLQLVAVDRHLALADAFERSGTMDDSLAHGSPVTVFEDDLVRGYRIDVLDETSGHPWRSLCRRDGALHLVTTGATVRVEDEEGVVRLGAQEAADPNDPLYADVLKIGETVFAWSGWSLTAPRPGLAIGPDDVPEDDVNVAPPGVPLESTYEVHPGSLPPLRFGHTYRARARLVDLAGNGVPFREGDGDVPPQASRPHTYRRYEPVPAPALALVDGAAGLERPNEGESLARMAIRSFNEQEQDASNPTAATIRRHVVPPQTSHVMAEQHGVLDGADGRPDPNVYALLTARDASLGEVSVLHEDPATSSSDLVTYPVGPEALDTPYLPDPLATVAVVRIDGDPREGPTERFEIRYDDGAPWPERWPFKLRIAELDGAVTAFDEATRTLTVPLGKAEMRRVRISHALRDDQLSLLAVWEMIRSWHANTPARRAALEAMAVRGEHWMLTPWLDVELVHAVQKPLVKPSFEHLVANRSLADTTATIAYATPVHAKSTAKLELHGRWVEPSDVAGEGAPRVLNQSGPAFEARLDRGDAPDGMFRTEGLHVFGDTRYRRVRYRLEAPTRFPEFMPSSIRSDPERMRVVSDEAVALVPNAGVPPAPDVVEITPTFGWSRSTSGTTMSSFRSGGGLRVWLRRPWFASGFGEMLAVVLAPSNAAAAQVTGPLAKHVTHWGADPIWRSGAVMGASPPASAFGNRWRGGAIPASRSPAFVPSDERELPAAPLALEGLILPDAGSVRVDVAPHPVDYDPGRDQYFCDVLVRPGAAYYPFVRLSLARYHPVSVFGAHLSPAVLGDFMQVAPDRLLTMSDGPRARTKTLRLYGHAYSRSPLKQERPNVDARPVIRVTLQRRAAGSDDDLAWQPVSDPSVDPVAPIAPIAPIAASAVAAHTATLHAAAADLPSIVRPLVLDFAAFLPPLLAEVTVSIPRRQPGTEFRVLVTEFERHSIDRDRPKRPQDAHDPSLRLTYAEAFDL
jgi:hypothetical protein